MDKLIYTMKYMKLLLIAALAPVLGFAQEATPTPSPSTSPIFAELAAVKTVAAAQAAEAHLVALIAASELTAADQARAAIRLSETYKRLVATKALAGGPWVNEILTKYRPVDGLPLDLELASAATLAEVAAVEVKYAASLPSLTATEKMAALSKLFQAYTRVAGSASGMDWIYGVFPKYVPNWETSTAPQAVQYYHYYNTVPATAKLQKDMAAAATVADFDAVMNAFLSKNVMPERLQELEDNRTWGAIFPNAVVQAVRLGHPEALNYALTFYRATGFQATQINPSVALVARAMKAKDMSLARANAFIACQNTGEAMPVITPEERATPAAIAASSVASAFVAPSLDKAKAKYRLASTSADVDGGVYEIAKALKGMDLNLVRANAWIKSQKDGTAFELP
jgi:hypothetical protein